MQRQLLHESSPCSSILSITSSILYGKIQQSTVFFQTVDPSPFWSSFAALSMKVSVSVRVKLLLLQTPSATLAATFSVQDPLMKKLQLAWLRQTLLSADSESGCGMITVSAQTRK